MRGHGHSPGTLAPLPGSFLESGFASRETPSRGSSFPPIAAVPGGTSRGAGMVRVARGPASGCGGLVSVVMPSSPCGCGRRGFAPTHPCESCSPSPRLGRVQAVPRAPVSSRALMSPCIHVPMSPGAPVSPHTCISTHLCPHAQCCCHSSSGPWRLPLTQVEGMETSSGRDVGF